MTLIFLCTIANQERRYIKIKMIILHYVFYYQNKGYKIKIWVFLISSFESPIKDFKNDVSRKKN